MQRQLQWTHTTGHCPQFTCAADVAATRLRVSSWTHAATLKSIASISFAARLSSACLPGIAFLSRVSSLMWNTRSNYPPSAALLFLFLFYSSSDNINWSTFLISERINCSLFTNLVHMNILSIMICIDMSSSWLLLPDVFLSRSPSWALTSPYARVVHCSMHLCYRGLFFESISSLAVLGWRCQLQLSPSRPSQRSVLETRSVGGRELHARHTRGRVLRAFLPFKPL